MVKLVLVVDGEAVDTRHYKHGVSLPEKGEVFAWTHYEFIEFDNQGYEQHDETIKNYFCKSVTKHYRQRGCTAVLTCKEVDE